MSARYRTAIVTGASQGIGAGVVRALVERGCRVVANSRAISRSAEVRASDRVVLVEGDIGDPGTAGAVVRTAVSRFGSVDVLVNNAGAFFARRFTDYTRDEIRSLISTNIEGFLYVTQQAIERMLEQGNGGCIVSITAALASNPIRGVTAAVPMLTKGGLDTITRQLAIEYAKDGIRVNAVAPGVVETPLHRDTPREVMAAQSPMGRPSSIKEVADAVVYLVDAAAVTGQILYVDGGAHQGHW